MFAIHSEKQNLFHEWAQTFTNITSKELNDLQQMLETNVPQE